MGGLRNLPGPVGGLLDEHVDLRPGGTGQLTRLGDGVEQDGLGQAQARVGGEAVDEVVRRLGDMEQLKMKDELKMSDDEYENNAVKEAAKVAEITLEQFAEDVGKFLASMEEQDAGFEDQVKQLLAQPGADTPEQREQLDQMRAMRKGAKEQMVRVSGILGRCIAA